MNAWVKQEQTIPNANSALVAVALTDRNLCYLVETNTIYKAPIMSDGRIGRFVVAGNINTAMSFNGGCIANDTLYLYGGLTPPAQVWAAKIGGDGSLGPFKAVNRFQNAFSTVMGFTPVNDWVYIIGGAGASGAILAECRAFRASDPGQFKKLSPLPDARQYIHTVYASGYLYAFGGTNGAFADTNTIYAARVEQDGNLGPWKQIGTLPVSTSRAAAVLAGDRIYVIGGRQSGASADNVWSFQVFPGGQLGPLKIEERFPVAIRTHLNSTFVHAGRIYVLGGFTTANVNTIYSTKL